MLATKFESHGSYGHQGCETRLLSEMKGAENMVVIK